MYLIEEVNKFRPQGCLITGEAENGKTFILHRLSKMVEKRSKINGQSVFIPFVLIEAPSNGSRAELFRKMGKGLHIPIENKINFDAVSPRIVQAISDAGTRVIFLDEMQHIAPSGKVKMRTFLDDLKTWSNQTGIPIIAAGTERAAWMIETDNQYWSRLRPLELPLWPLDQNYLGLLAAIERGMGIDSGTFTNSRTSELIWKHSEKLIGRTFGVLKLAQKLAADAGSSQITDKHINSAGLGNLPFIRLKAKR
jgi:hypothetical protein